MSERRLKSLEKEKRAVEMRLAGVPVRQIAETLGYSSGSSVSKAIRRLMEETAHEPAEHLRQLEVERCDRMITALWPQALAGKWLAVDRVLRVMERKAALQGLDAPQKRILEVITPDAFRAALEEKEEQLRQLEMATRAAEPVIDVDFEELDEELDEEVPVAAVVIRKGDGEQDARTD